MDKVHLAQHVLESPKTVTSSAVLTGAAGAANVLDWIPDEIGKLAAVIGIIITISTFYFYRRKMILETKLLEFTIREQEQRVTRLKSGMPSRRGED